MSRDDHDTFAELIRRPAWQADAACTEHPELTWFPERQNATRESPRAKSVCAGCLVRDDCLAYALEHDLVGIWGGTSTGARASMLRAGSEAA